LARVPPGFSSLRPNAGFAVRARRLGAVEDDELGKLYINLCTLDLAELGSEATLLLDKGRAVIQYTLPYAPGVLRDEADPFGLPTLTVDLCVTPKTLQFCTNPAFQLALVELAIKEAEPLLPLWKGSPQRVSLERWHRLVRYDVWGCGPRRLCLEEGRPALEATLQTPARKPSAAETQQQQQEQQEQQQQQADQQRAEQQQAEQQPAEPAEAEIPNYRIKTVAKLGKGKKDDATRKGKKDDATQEGKKDEEDDATRQLLLFVDLPKIRDYGKEVTVLFEGAFTVRVKSQDTFLSFHNYDLTVTFETSIRTHETKHKNWDKRGRTLELLVVTDATTPEAVLAREAQRKDREQRIKEQHKQKQQARQYEEQVSELRRAEAAWPRYMTYRERPWMRLEASDLGRSSPPARPPQTKEELDEELAQDSVGAGQPMGQHQGRQAGQGRVFSQQLWRDQIRPASSAGCARPVYHNSATSTCSAYASIGYCSRAC
jgi:hypothetical protein